MQLPIFRDVLLCVLISRRVIVCLDSETCYYIRLPTCAPFLMTAKQTLALGGYSYYIPLSTDCLMGTVNVAAKTTVSSSGQNQVRHVE